MSRFETFLKKLAMPENMECRRDEGGRGGRLKMY
jgi:hypothetical protein